MKEIQPYVKLIREVADKLDKDFRGNLDFAIAELYNLSLRLQKGKTETTYLTEEGINFCD